MYNASDAYKTAMAQLARVTSVRGTLTLLDGTIYNITDSDIVGGSLSIDNACVNGQEYNIGTVYVGQLQVALYTKFPNRYVLFGATIELEFGVKTAGGTFEYIPLGKYKINDATHSGRSIKIVAYDDMLLLDKPFSTIVNGTAWELLLYSATQCGLTLAQTQEEIEAISPFANGEPVILKVGETATYETFRDLVSDLAMTLGGFATINRNGLLEIRRMGTESIEITNNRRKTIEISDYQIAFTGCSAVIDEVLYNSGTVDGQVMQLENQLWRTGVKDSKQAIIDNIAAALININYTPIKAEIDGDPCFDIGDKIRYTGGTAEDGVESFIMTYAWTYKSKQNIASVGSNPKLASAKSRVEKAVDSTAKTADNNNCKTSIYSLASKIDVGKYEELLCDMELSTSQKTNLVFHGQAVINITKPGTVTVRYTMDGEEQGYILQDYVPYAGMKALNLFIPLADVGPEYSHIFEANIYSDDGCKGTILPGAFTAAISGANIASSGGFTGQIKLKANLIIRPFGAVNIPTMTETMTHELINPTGPVLSDSFLLYKYSGLGVGNIEETMDMIIEEST